MKYYLDTNICIYFLKGLFPQLKNKILSFNPGMIIIPSIVKAELLYGAERSKKKEDNFKNIYQFLLPFHIESFTDGETVLYAQIRNSLEEKGTLIGPNDLLIASIVLSHDGTLITNNTKEFSRIKNLKIEDWTQEQ
jgi:tRNA(fMet)-specific endonuclease VapC